MKSFRLSKEIAVSFLLNGLDKVKVPRYFLHGIQSDLTSEVDIDGREQLLKGNCLLHKKLQIAFPAAHARVGSAGTDQGETSIFQDKSEYPLQLPLHCGLLGLLGPPFEASSKVGNGKKVGEGFVLHVYG